MLPVLGSGSAGIPRYSAPPYVPMVRPPVFTPRPPVGPPPVAMVLPRPPGTGIRSMPPVLKPPPGMILNDLAAKGIGQIAAPPEKPHTTVYVGKIAPTVEDEFLRAILEVSATGSSTLTGCFVFVKVLINLFRGLAIVRLRFSVVLTMGAPRAALWRYQELETSTRSYNWLS